MKNKKLPPGMDFEARVVEAYQKKENSKKALREFLSWFPFELKFPVIFTTTFENNEYLTSVRVDGHVTSVTLGTPSFKIPDTKLKPLYTCDLPPFKPPKLILE